MPGPPNSMTGRPRLEMVSSRADFRSPISAWRSTKVAREELTLSAGFLGAATRPCPGSTGHALGLSIPNQEPLQLWFELVTSSNPLGLYYRR